VSRETRGSRSSMGHRRTRFPVVPMAISASQKLDFRWSSPIGAEGLILGGFPASQS
jgi:hypothetical protein